MRRDGARVVDVNGSYEEAVRAAAAFATSERATVVSDTSWPGYEEVPRWIMAGYTHLFAEAERQWPRAPDAIVIQGGVGGLVCAGASWAAWRFGANRPAIVACEPDGAACLMASMDAGSAVSLEGPLDTIMSGLRCGEPSPAAWPTISDGVDACVSVSDQLVLETIDRLHHGSPGIDAGPSGGCGVAAVAALMREPALEPARRALRLDRSTRVMAIVTEGP
jgi:diaminopropionate ammonia-lyase